MRQYVARPRQECKNQLIVGAVLDDVTECVATYSWGCNHQSFAMPQLGLWCSAALVPKFTILKSGMMAQVSLETTTRTPGLELHRTPTPSNTTYRCLLMWHKGEKSLERNKRMGVIEKRDGRGRKRKDERKDEKRRRVRDQMGEWNEVWER